MRAAALRASQASVLCVDDALQEEIHRYSSVLQIEIDSCPLKWWKEHEAKLSHLSKAAREVLAVPATSAPSEPVFFPNLLKSTVRKGSHMVVM